MTPTTFLLLIAGLVLLVAGAEFLVRGASRVAAALQISPLIIGLTIVAYGTSAPEMFVSTMSSFSGQGDIAMGNVVGSNICNVLLILGLSEREELGTCSRRLRLCDFVGESNRFVYKYYTNCQNEG